MRTMASRNCACGENDGQPKCASVWRGGGTHLLLFWHAQLTCVSRSDLLLLNNLAVVEYVHSRGWTHVSPTTGAYKKHRL